MLPLKKGKDCFIRIMSENERVGVDLSNNVMTFFVKISVFFRMRKLNSIVRINKNKTRLLKVKKENLIK